MAIEHHSQENGMLHIACDAPPLEKVRVFWDKLRLKWTFLGRHRDAQTDKLESVLYYQ